ncbi:hypothetical protein BHF70_09005 [Anaerostipes sp. 494a]|uniref:hypothetical protein n=1 Tax=Anaerostipes sp. 494a TaxID=1261636 RepID=UPI000952FDF6|nr:hypothetical protein [Anaerostipes sp. 494a]OLR59736.1 hypothetical protein BHF70_09005 [Anaerostipes sp. 494a]
MYFLLSTNPDIIGTKENRMARLKFINDITGVVPTPWEYFKLCNEGKLFLICNTFDGLNGIYITAHNYEVVEICRTGFVSNVNFLVANTCVYRENLDTDILWLLRQQNKNIRLWYAKQDLELIYDHVLRNTNLLRDAGTFGFMTSKSDRLMFKNRKKGFETALKLSFDRVSGLYGV